MGLIFKGYKVSGTDLRAVEDVLSEIQKQVELKAKRLYHKLLAYEIELMVDDISTALVKNRPACIYDACVEELNRKVSWASGSGSPTPYNLRVQATIYTYMNDSYIKLTIPNHAILKEIKKINGATSFDLNESDSTVSNTNFKVWNEIMNIYSNDVFPMARQLYPLGPIDISWKMISSYFRSIDERQDERIRHQLTSELMNLLGMKQQIPDTRLMPYFDEAFKLLSLPAVKEEAERRKAQSTAVFVNITEEMVKTNLNAPAPNTFDQAKVVS